MDVLQAMPALLRIVHDAEDEMATLRDGCAWVRDHVGAEGVGIVTRDTGRLVASDGLTAADLHTGLVRDVLRQPAGTVVAEGEEVGVSAPVRYGGSTIGFTVVRGRAAQAESIAEAAAALSALCAPACRARLDALALMAASHSLAPEILGVSTGIVSVREAIARAAGATFPVLIEGESGTGKELVARAVHRLSPRRDRRLCAVNCAALTDELVEAELFGHARGAFTGAVGTRVGLFEDASGGSLFLDEVSELSPRAQAKLLRALQEREIRRLGENVPRAIDVRVISAANVSLGEAVGLGRFREDLLFRLAVVRIRLPPLRERLEDVPVLTHAFWRRLAPEAGKRAVLAPDAIAALCRHRWPGNVRELQNVLAGLAVSAPVRGRITARHVALAVNVGAPSDQSLPLDVARRSFEQRLVSAALARHAGRRSAAARDLGLTRQGLTKAIKRLGLQRTG